MHAYQTEIGQTYRHEQTIMRRIAGTPQCEFVGIHSGLWYGFGPLVEVEPISDPGNETHHRCAQCGDMQPVSALELTTENYYDWDDPDEDAQGSILHTRTVWKCRSGCAPRTHAPVAEDMYSRGIGHGWSVQP